MNTVSSNPLVMQLAQVGLFREWLKDNSFNYIIGAIDIIESRDGSEQLIFILRRGDGATSSFGSVDTALRSMNDLTITSAFQTYLRSFTRTRYDRLWDAVQIA